MARVLVACLGNGLAGDCAAGSAVHGLLSGCTLPEGARLRLVGPGPTRLLLDLDGEEALVAVGEVETGARPGTIHLLDWHEVPLGGDRGARIGNVLRVTMEAALIRDPDRAPRRAFLVGIEGRGHGGRAGGLHPEVASALAGAARLALDLASGLAGLEGEGLVDLERIALADPGTITRPARSTPARLLAEVS
jgi:hydrogenase maturation protease